MARSEEQIQAELQESILATDKTLDVEQGPLPDVFIRPQAGQLAEASSEAESLRLLFTLEFEESATEAEVRNALANYGSMPGEGRKARHIQHFLRFTRPIEDITVPAGTLVSNLSGALTYRVVSAGTMTAAAAESFFNTSRNAYEIGLLVEAVGIGEAYNLPENRISTITTPVEGIDATQNRVKSRGGSEAESKESQAERLKNSLKGINKGAPGGLEASITDALPEILTDTAVIQPFEKEFTRLTSGPALDIYVIGDTSETWTQYYTASGGETQLALEKVPALSISTLTVNGVSGVIGYTLVPDTTPESGYSLNALDLVVFDSPLSLGDQIVVEYAYNGALEEVESEIFSNGTEYLFNTDMLVRQPVKIAPVIGGRVQALASFSSTEVENEVLNYFATALTFTRFTELVLPETMRQGVISTVSGVQNFTFTEFRRSSGSSATIEPLLFAGNEISVFDSTLYNVTVIS
jgi:hypothetical protein